MKSLVYLYTMINVYYDNSFDIYVLMRAGIGISSFSLRSRHLGLRQYWLVSTWGLASALGVAGTGVTGGDIFLCLCIRGTTRMAEEGVIAFELEERRELAAPASFVSKLSDLLA